MTSLIKHLKSLIYACKHKYKNKTNKKNKSRPQNTLFWISEIYLKHPLSLGFHLENFASYKLVRPEKNFV